MIATLWRRMLAFVIEAAGWQYPSVRGRERMSEAQRPIAEPLEDIDLTAMGLDNCQFTTSLRLSGPDEQGDLTISLWPGEGLNDVEIYLDDASVDRLIAALRRRQVVIAEQRVARGC